MPKITKSLIDSIAITTREQWHWCAALPGFGVRVQPSGRLTFVARYRTLDGQQRKLTIGRCCDLTPDQAREIARRTFAAVAAGEDPAAKRAEDRAAPTVADLADRYMRLHAMPYKKPGSVRHDEMNWRLRILPVIGRKRVEHVTQADVMALHGSLHASPVTANHVRALISHAMNMAIKWGWRTAANPAIGVPRFRIRQRDTVLNPDQLGQLDAAITRLTDAKRISHQHADLFRLLALTGCRLSEIMTARREWIDIDRRLLLLPDSKVGQRRVNLPLAAIAIIQAMPPNKWLIPGKLHDRPMRTPHYAWKRSVAEAGLPSDLRIHDLRHTAGSLGHRAGLSQRQIADMLGHRNLATTERYLHGFVEDRVRAVDVVSDTVTLHWAK